MGADGEEINHLISPGTKCSAEVEKGIDLDGTVIWV